MSEEPAKTAKEWAKELGFEDLKIRVDLFDSTVSRYEHPYIKPYRFELYGLSRGAVNGVGGEDPLVIWDGKGPIFGPEWQSLGQSFTYLVNGKAASDDGVGVFDTKYRFSQSSVVERALKSFPSITDRNFLVLCTFSVLEAYKVLGLARYLVKHVLDFHGPRFEQLFRRAHVCERAVWEHTVLESLGFKHVPGTKYYARTSEGPDLASA